MNFLSTDMTICRPLKGNSGILLDNRATIRTDFNASFAEIYNKRKQFLRSRVENNAEYNILCDDGKCPFYIPGAMLWDEVIMGPFWPLDSVDDFISQVNFAGFHDICNFFEEQELEHFVFENETRFDQDQRSEIVRASLSLIFLRYGAGNNNLVRINNLEPL